MKKISSFAVLLFLFSSLTFAQKQGCDEQLKIDLEQFQSDELSISSLGYTGSVQKETFVSKVYYPDVEVKKFRRFRPKKGKTYTEESLAYNKITPEDALKVLIQELNEMGCDTFCSLRIRPETKHLKTGTRIREIPGYRIEGVALNL
jgi:hypothetical protein